MRELVNRGHDVLFIEREIPWTAARRDLFTPPYGRTSRVRSYDDLVARHGDEVREADFVILGSQLPEGVRIADWVFSTARGGIGFYDIDTLLTLAKLERQEEDYLARRQVPRFDLYLSFTGGPALERVRRAYGARRPRPLFCSVDPAIHHPAMVEASVDLGYLGTYRADRQAGLEELLVAPARAWPEGRFSVVGPEYPESIRWPDNVQRAEHLPPEEHRAFYGAQRFTLNVTRRDAYAGYSPSVRLFEAAACGTPIISDDWEGLSYFFEPENEILIARSSSEVLAYLTELPERQRRAIAERARATVLALHTASHRALELERYLLECFEIRLPRGGHSASPGASAEQA
jgi:spore maturation protein CgeB